MRCLSNIRHSNINGICIEASNMFENEDLLLFQCSNCRIRYHLKCVLGENIQFYKNNETDPPLCGVCSGLMQLNGLVFMESIDEIGDFGEESILHTIHFITCRIKFSLLYYYIILYCSL